jgi:predicted nucleic acid-binding Zn ribbon protein
MSMESLDENAVSDTDADLQSDAIKDQLRKDVASWREGRADGTSREATGLSVAVAKPAPRARRAKPAPGVVVPDAKKKPFGMSYDGSTNADYINYMISRGAR